MGTKKGAKAPAPSRTTINLPNDAHMTLSKMVLLLKKKNITTFKQQLAAAMIEYFRKNSDLLVEILTQK